MSPKTMSNTTFCMTLNQQMSENPRMVGWKKNFQTIRMFWKLGSKFTLTKDMQVKIG